jgi:hypothetical protein
MVKFSNRIRCLKIATIVLFGPGVIGDSRAENERLPALDSTAKSDSAAGKTEVGGVVVGRREAPLLERLAEEPVEDLRAAAQLHLAFEDGHGPMLLRPILRLGS